MARVEEEERKEIGGKLIEYAPHKGGAWKLQKDHCQHKSRVVKIYAVSIVC